MLKWKLLKWYVTTFFFIKLKLGLNLETEHVSPNTVLQEMQDFSPTKKKKLLCNTVLSYHAAMPDVVVSLMVCQLEVSNFDMH